MEAPLLRREPTFEQELAWAARQSHLTRKVLSKIPKLEGIRIAFSVHLDIKNAVTLRGFLALGAKVFITTCNPATVRNEVVEDLKTRGADVFAWKDMSDEEWENSITAAAQWNPTHICDMGGKLALRCADLKITSVRAGMEGTGSGVHALQANPASLSWPTFNWNDISLKEGIHNRHMVGIAATHAFFNKTHLTFHGRHVVVVGFGPVGEGCCEAALFYGGSVTVVDRDPAALFRAKFAGYHISESLESVLPSAGVVITATGAAHVIKERHMSLLPDGCFLINVGHFAFEIDTPEIYQKYRHETVLPFVEEVFIPSENGSGASKSVFMFSDGKMANLTAGYGDSINAFDITLAIMTAAIAFIMTPEAEKYEKGTHLLPASVWKSVL